MKTICKTVFTFDELSEDLKKKALERNSDINVDFDWWDFVVEDAKSIGEILGIDIDKIYFSGFYSQGDGACFVGDYSYKKGARKAIREYAPQDKELHTIADGLFNLQKRYFFDLAASIKHSGRYYHSNSTSINIWRKNNDACINDKDDADLEEILRDFMNWIYRRLESEYDYRTSEEAIIETFEANEYHFDEKGKICA